MSYPIAIVTADWHLSSTCPPARSGEKDWFKAMERSLTFLFQQARMHNIPILVAGDIFDHWKATPELINFCLDVFPRDVDIFSIPGQHDLPNHSYTEINKSAYMTLIKSGLIKDTYDKSHLLFSDLYVRLAGWEQDLCIPPKKNTFSCNLGLIHKYLWVPDASYPNAPMSSKVTKKLIKSYAGYDIIVSGDNHKHFSTSTKPMFYNCGALFRRKSDEIDYKPSFGIVSSDKTVERVFIPTHEEVISPTTKISESLSNFDIASYLKNIKRTDSLDFLQALDNILEKSSDVSKEVIKLITEVCDEFRR